MIARLVVCVAMVLVGALFALPSDVADAAAVARSAPSAYDYDASSASTTPPASPRTTATRAYDPVGDPWRSRTRVSGARVAAKDENIVYRGLAEGEQAAAGLTARNPAAGNDVVSHVGGARNSQWISTTRDLAKAQERFGKHGVVAIDLSRVPNPIADLSGGISGMNPNYMLSRWARRNREVLIQGHAPRQAIRRVP